MKKLLLYAVLLLGLQTNSYGNSQDLTFDEKNLSAAKQTPLGKYFSSFDHELGEFTLEDNPNFLKEMDDILKQDNKTHAAMIIITCGSGFRSAEAARRLIAEGYTNVWHIPEGYDGDEKPGLNTNNAWKLSGLPWSYDLVKGSEWRLLIKNDQKSR